MQKIANYFGKDLTYFLHLDLTKFGDRLRYLRTQQLMSVAELSQKLNVLEDTVYSWEGGNRKPSRKCLLKLVEIFGEELINQLTYSNLLEHNLKA